MAVITPQVITGGTASVGTNVITYPGLTPAAGVAAAATDLIPNDGRTFVEVVNGGGASITVTVDQVKPDSMGRTFDPVITVAAAATRWFGPFPPILFNNPSNQVQLTYSGISSVTVRAFKLVESGFVA